MIMKKVILLVLAVVLFAGISYAKKDASTVRVERKLEIVAPIVAPKVVPLSVEIPMKEAVETRIQRLNRISDNVVANRDLLRQIHSKGSVGGAVGLVAENLNSNNGWSLTGYTKTGLTEWSGKTVLYRAKTGIINAELSADSDYFAREEWDPQNRRKWADDLDADFRRNCVFGFFVTFRW
jgi:hypothetical protein